MFYELIKAQKQRKHLISGLLTLIIFLGIYSLLDHFNGGYEYMLREFGLFLVIVNVFLNFIMSFLSAIMLNVSSSFLNYSGKEGKGSFLTTISIIFGFFTYGCTPCVISFLAIFGITFSVAILPLAGLPYKLISLLILIIGFIYLRYEINHYKCKKETK